MFYIDKISDIYTSGFEKVPFVSIDNYIRILLKQ